MFMLIKCNASLINNLSSLKGERARCIEYNRIYILKFTHIINNRDSVLIASGITLAV